MGRRIGVAILIVLFMASIAHAAHGLAVIKMAGGLPVIASVEPPYTNWVSLGDLPGGYGLYIVSATKARLATADDLPGVYGFCLLTTEGDIKWAELDKVLSPAARTKLNTYLVNHGYQAIPATWTSRQVVVAILGFINSKSKLNDFYVADKE